MGIGPQKIKGHALGKKEVILFLKGQPCVHTQLLQLSHFVTTWNVALPGLIGHPNQEIYSCRDWKDSDSQPIWLLSCFLPRWGSSMPLGWRGEQRRKNKR